MNNQKQPTLYWHDYETWGANPQKDHPCQFAGVRTDLDLNVISKPLEIFCQPPSDYLPHPEACLITGITPQQAIRDGYCEADFIAKIHHEFSQPNTCVVGYNNIRFDDEVTRYTLYRNFYDPYAREWQQGNSRWDIIDMVRACYALRPDGIEWVFDENDVPKFKLELLTQANGIGHQQAHDAVSDVLATIALAKLIKEKQPKLYDYLFELRDKKKVAKQFDVFNMTPLVHVSSKFPAINGCCSWIAPICFHPTNKNAIICYNLGLDPEPLFELNSEQIQQKLYTKTSDLMPDEERIGLKSVHLNKCPVVASAKMLSPENAERLGIDRNKCLQNWQRLKKHPELREKVAEVFQQEHSETEQDPDHALYSGGFFSASDRAKMEMVRQAEPAQLQSFEHQFEDPRLSEMLFRLRARNYPNTLTSDEVVRWQQHRKERLMDGKNASISMEEFGLALENLSHEYAIDKNKLAILKDLYLYAQAL